MAAGFDFADRGEHGLDRRVAPETEGGAGGGGGGVAAHHDGDGEESGDERAGDGREGLEHRRVTDPSAVARSRRSAGRSRLGVVCIAQSWFVGPSRWSAS